MVMGIFLTGRPGQLLYGLLLCAAHVFLACFFITPVQAAERELATQPRSALDVVLVFDASGSMLKTDPDSLRYQGAKLLLSFLGEGDRIGVVGFAGAAKVVRDLEPFSQAVSAEVAKQIEGIQADGAFSDIAEGIKLGKAVLDGRPGPDAQRVMVLLSDGKMEPNPAVVQSFARTLELVHDVLPELKSKEIKVFTLAFSAQADRPFLAEIAAATDGLTWYTATSQDIHKSFADLFLAIKRPQVVSQTGRGFKIDDDVAEATFYINHESGAELTLESPRGELLSASKPLDHVTWFSAKNFDVITIKEPDPGDWKVLGATTPDGFATVLTDLKLLTDWPIVIRAGDEPLVQARLYEENKPVSLPEMSGVVTYAFQILPTDRISQPIAQEEMRDDGKGHDKVALDGIFSAKTALETAGEYKLTVVAKGPTFQRSQQIPFTVRPRLVHLEVVSDEQDTHETEVAETRNNHEHAGAKTEASADVAAHFSGSEKTEFSVKVSKEAISFKSYGLSLVAISEDRQKTEIEMKRTRGSEFSVAASNLPAAGKYTVKAILKGETKKGQEVEGESEQIRFVYSPRVARRDVLATPSPAVNEKEHGHERKGEEEKFPAISLGLITGINIIVFTSLYIVARRQKRNGGALPPRYFPHKQLLDAIALLEERTSATRIELTDPIFKVVETDRISGVGEVSQSVSPPPGDQPEVVS